MRAPPFILLSIAALSACDISWSGDPPGDAMPPDEPPGAPQGSTAPPGQPQNPQQPPNRPGSADAGIVFGSPGPWPIANVTYGRAHGILEAPVVGVTTDEAQNVWIATHTALYVLRPGQTQLRRYTSADGLHLMDNPVAYCDSSFGDRACPIYGGAAEPGISEIVGGGPDEVFVGYYGHDEGTGDWHDPNRHSGKVDRVRLKADGTLEVDRFDFVANAHGAQYWHNRTVHRMVYDHFVHQRELYVGMNHGVTRVRPDQYRKPEPGEWFDKVNMEYMADHLHPRVCFHAPCDPNSEANQRMGGWRGLAIALDGDLWVAGKWTAGKIRYDPSLVTWFSRPGAKAFAVAFGDPYPVPANAEGFVNEPVFKVLLEGDPVNLVAVAVAPDGRVWFATSGYDVGPQKMYGLAVWDGRKFVVYEPKATGLPEAEIRDLVALPDGRLVIAGPRSGLVVWDPRTNASTPMRTPAYLADDRVKRVQLDTMVNPPALQVATELGASFIRVLPK